MKNIVIDIDNTITMGDTSDYENVSPNLEVIKQLRKYKSNKFKITLHTARNMRSFDGNLGKINKITLPILLKWLEKHDVPFDEIIMGKPWCGKEGFYVDDRAIRPDEFISKSYKEIEQIISKK